MSAVALWLDRNEHRIVKVMTMWTLAWLALCFTWLTLRAFEQAWVSAGIQVLAIAIHTSNLRWCLRRRRSLEDPS